MTTSHKLPATRSERESVAPTWPIERDITPVTPHHITYITGRESVILRSEQGTRRRSLPQKMVESASRTEHPLDPDVRLAPAFLELRPQQLRHRPRQIQRAAVPEVQPSPHRVGVYARGWAWRDNSTMFRNGEAA